MFNSNKINLNKTNIGFEDVINAINNNLFLIINTLPIDKQNCLIKNTIPIEKEEIVINELINNYDYDKPIIIYGINNTDDSVIKKYNQLINIGFKKIFIYLGGMFEWLLLQDVYGKDEFKTNIYTKDILFYKPKKIINIH